ncbi:MAG: DUF2989 domain-containing protein, partial [Colwellia sp.]
MKKILECFLLLLLLSACDNKPNFVELCDNNTEICNEFEQDSWCKRERINVGFANLEQKLATSDIHKYNQLIGY